jgi:hypothetical protein
MQTNEHQSVPDRSGDATDYFAHSGTGPAPAASVSY